jgi:mRNA-degrading endonuclease HigB of HigAB toxin-antitoxin module
LQVHNLRELDKFLKTHKTATEEITAWLAIVRLSVWPSVQDLKADWPKIHDIFPNSVPARIVFKLGQHWRIDTTIDFVSGIVYIERVDSHEAYNKWKYERPA